MKFTNSQLNAIIANLPKHTLADYAESGHSIDIYLKGLFAQLPDPEYLKYLKKSKDESDWFDESGQPPKYVVDAWRQHSRNMAEGFCDLKTAYVSDFPPNIDS